MPFEVFSGGGYFYDDVLEYRVWVYEDGNLECHSFETYEDALSFSKMYKAAEQPVVLVLQKEYIDEQEPGEYVHIKRERLAEWRTEWLDKGNRGSHARIPGFLATKRRKER